MAAGTAQKAVYKVQGVLRMMLLWLLACMQCLPRSRQFRRGGWCGDKQEYRWQHCVSFLSLGSDTMICVAAVLQRVCAAVLQQDTG
jgi:hypothetical protein